MKAALIFLANIPQAAPSSFSLRAQAGHLSEGTWEGVHSGLCMRANSLCAAQTLFNLRHGLVCTAKEIKVATRGFPFCACGHNPTRLPSLVFIIWKANLEEQTDVGDEEKDKLRKVIVFIEKT